MTMLARRPSVVLDQTITIQLDSAPGQVEVDANVWDQWAAHKSWARPGWSVTHVPTGRRVPSKDLTAYQAQTLATVLARQGVHFTPEESADGCFPADVSDRVQKLLTSLRLAK